MNLNIFDLKIYLMFFYIFDLFIKVILYIKRLYVILIKDLLSRILNTCIKMDIVIFVLVSQSRSWMLFAVETSL